jgi:carboxyl-terminal processing protease
MLKKSILFFVVIWGCVVSAYAEQPQTADRVTFYRALSPTPDEEVACRNIMQNILHKGYKKIKTNDSLSLEIFNRYVTNLDSDKSLFVASEIDSLRNIYGTRILDECLAGNLNTGFAIYNLFLRRTKEKINFMHLALSLTDVNFSTQESLGRDHKFEVWCSDRSQLTEHWKKEFKYWWLNFLYAGESNKTIRFSLAKSLSDLENYINRKRHDDAFRAYIFAVTTSFDPHTSYLSPHDLKDFRIEMSNSVEGVGIKIDATGEYTVITEVIPGTSASRSHQLKKGDKIIGVGQGMNNKITDVFGWRIEDIAKLIRGRKGSMVNIKYFPAGQSSKGSEKIVRLIRDKIDLEDELVKKNIIQQDGFKIGVISIPSFYLDFEGWEKKLDNYRRVSNDLTRILNELMAVQVDGIVIDLRNNRGGALDEAVRVTGLFIPLGPVVQIADSAGRIKLLSSDASCQQLYNGPLAVLVNRSTASASEIFTAAIQDYGRGIIIGERTFGKGTVQSIDKLSRLKSSSELGEVKLTTAKFYRISGGSTQHIGVIPDIIVPSMIDKPTGEDTYKSSLPWSTISQALYCQTGEISSEEKGVLLNKFNERSSKNILFQDYLHDVTVFNWIHNKKTISLRSSIFKSESETIRQIKKKYIKKDILVNEAVKVIVDQINFKKK